MKAKPISEAALAVLSGLNIFGTMAKITGGQLDRKLYQEVNAALEALGGKWSRKAGAHVFPKDPGPLVDDLIDAGGYVVAPTEKQALGFFETPPEIAARMEKTVWTKKGDRVLEPSVGYGRLLAHVHPNANVVAIEIVADRPRHFMDDALSRFYRPVHLHRDFLTVRPADLGDPFDVVLMNPPFARQQDILHITHALSFLKPGGRLAAIASAGVTYRYCPNLNDVQIRGIGRPALGARRATRDQGARGRGLRRVRGGDRTIRVRERAPFNSESAPCPTVKYSRRHPTHPPRKILMNGSWTYLKRPDCGSVSSRRFSSYFGLSIRYTVQ